MDRDADERAAPPLHTTIAGATVQLELEGAGRLGVMPRLEPISGAYAESEPEGVVALVSFHESIRRIDHRSNQRALVGGGFDQRKVTVAVSPGSITGTRTGPISVPGVSVLNCVEEAHLEIGQRLPRGRRWRPRRTG